MTENANLAKLNEVFCEIFQEPELRIRPEMTAKDVYGWDSFNHINLVIAVETAFGLTFTNLEIAGLARVDDLTKLMQSKGMDISW